MPLPREHGRDATAPDFLDSRQDAQLVIDKHVAVCRIAFLNVIKLELFVDIDQHVAIHGCEQPGASDLERLENHVTVGQDYRAAISLHMINRIQSIGKEPVREWIFHEKVRNRQQVWIARIFRAVTLEGAKIVRIPQL